LSCNIGSISNLHIPVRANGNKFLACPELQFVISPHTSGMTEQQVRVDHVEQMKVFPY